VLFRSVGFLPRGADDAYLLSAFRRSL